jgi:fructose/tagatose bisphosphate aldolase
MASEELKLVITVDKEGAISGIKQVQEAEKDLQKETEQTSLKFTEFNQLTELLSKGLNLASSGFSALVTTIKQGALIDDVSSAFSRLADNAGTTAEIFLKDLNAATGGTISNFNLMRQANEALQKGLTPEQFTAISAAARELSDTLGTDLNQEMQQLSQALETGNTKILQNKIGIVDLKAAEDEYAQTLGIKREQLTREQQVMAARTAIMSAMSDEAERGLQIDADSADIIDQITKKLDDQIGAVQRSIGKNLELNAALGAMRDILARIDFGPIIDGLTQMAVNAVKSANVLIGAFVDAKKNIQLVGDYLRVNFNSTISDTSARAKELNEQFTAMTRTLPPTSENIKKAKDILTQLSTELRQTRAEAAKNPDANLGDLADAAAESNDEMRDLITRLNEYEASASLTVTTTDDASVNVDKLTTSVTRLNAAMGTGAVNTTKFNNAVKYSSSQQFEPGASGKPSWISRTFGTDLIPEQEIARISQEMQQATAQAIGNGLRLAFDGGNSQDWKALSKNTGSQIGGSIGSGFGPVGEAVGSFLGEKLGKGIFDGFNHVFGGGRSDETRARKRLQAFFDEALKDRELEIIVDGGLKELFKFDRLKGSFPENFRELFSNLDDTAENAFAGIGTALGNALKIDAKDWDNLNFLLAENLGNLNNLQLVMKMTGQSAEEMAANIVDAFLKSNISADEAMAALDGVRKAFEEGIPDGVGMTAQSFENLAISGGKGYAAIDAVKDIFIEAGEKGITTFDQLRKDLLVSGKTIEQVDAFFASLTQRGITSFEQILQGSDEFLIGIIANLDNTGFKFAEIVETIDDLGQKLDDLERGRDIDIRLNVTTNATASAQALIDAGALPGVA